MSKHIPSKFGKCKFGIYVLDHPEKYLGDPSKVYFRSGLERLYMRRFDTNPNVIKWSSEEITISYISPIDGKYHRYFPDFYVECQDENTKEIVKMLIEVKPDSQTRPPKGGKGKKRSRLLLEQKAYGINTSKWESAKEFCKKRGWEFVIATEKTLKNK